MKYSDKNPPLCCMQTQSRCYRNTSKMKIKGVLWHDTAGGNPYIKRYVQPSDNAPDKAYWLKLLGTNQYHNDWNHVERSAGLNCWVGKLADGTVTTVQSMPWDYAPWGCGGGPKGSCNDGWIQFEICDDDYKNGKSTKAYFEAVYKEACEITAYLCKKYNIDPKGTVMYNGVKVPTILCHYDSYKLGLGGNHGDVYSWFNKYGKNMDSVRNDVAKLMGTQPEPKPVPPTPTPTPTPTTNIIKGDLVQIIGNTYYNSTKTIPSWAKADKWYVSSVTNDYAILGQNEKKNNNLDSKVALKDLKKVGGSPTPTPTPTKKGYTGTFPTLPSRGYFQKGDKGTEVKNLQNFLLWYDPKCLPKYGADGSLGDEGIAAVKKFQAAEKLVADGLFGKSSLEAAKKVTK